MFFESNEASAKANLLATLPGWIQELLEPFTIDDEIEEIALDLERPVKLTLSGDRYEVLFGREGSNARRTVSEGDLGSIVAGIGGSFRDDHRRGIPGTLHRVSAIVHGGKVVGLSMRFARAITGVADELAPFLLQGSNMLILGPPGRGKTTLLRDLIRIASLKWAHQVLVVDSSAEIAGEHYIPHPAIGHARRLEVSSKALQARVIHEAVRNHSPKLVAVDEIGYAEDVEQLCDGTRRGVYMLASAHGACFSDLAENRTVSPLVGDPDWKERRRRSRCVVGVLVVVVDKGKYQVFDNLDYHMDEFLAGRSPQPILLGNWSVQSRLRPQDSLELPLR